MSIATWISKDPLQRGLCIAIPAIHLLIIAVSFVAYPSLKKASSKSLVINTWTPPASPSKQVRTNTTAPSLPKKTSVAAPAPAAKKVTKTVTAEPQKAPTPKKEKVAINPKPATKQAPKTPSLAQKHLQEIEERIAKIEAKNDRMPIKSELAVPTTITLSSQIPSQNSEFTNYQTFAMEDPVSSLIGYLQGYLQLPDIGEVQIQLVLRKDGKVESMKVLKTESAENRKYLEEHLPKMSFPPSILEGVSSRSFLLTFCNK